MKRRNFLAALAVAVLVPWKEVLPQFADVRTKLPYTMPTITALTNVGPGFRVGDLVTVYDSSGMRESVVMEVLYRDDIANTLFVTEHTDRRMWPAQWQNLARHA